MGQSENASDLKVAVEHARAVARHQLAAAFQVHLDRVREEMESIWRRHLDDIFEERFAAVEGRLREGFDRTLEKTLAERRNEALETLNQTARRLRASESREEWGRTLMEAAQAHCTRAELIWAAPKGLKYKDEPEIPVRSAPAFWTVVESNDTVVAVATERELSPELFASLGASTAKRVYLFPVLVRQNVVAILYAEGGERPVEVAPLELLAVLAAASVESIVPAPAADKSVKEDLIQIAPAVAAAPVAPSKAPVWSDLPRAEQEQHLRAQRFARTRVAEMLLHKAKQVQAGREKKNLYGTLKEEIEGAREAFRQEFIETCPSMVDYFHLELQRTLAKDDAVVLGAEYPGPLPVGTTAN